MKGNKRDLVKKYGKDAEAVMYGRATNMAKKKTENMRNPKITELIKDALKNPKKADLNKDGKLSDYEETRGAAIEKNLKENDVFPEDDSYLELNSYYIDQIKRDLEELDDKEANKFLEDLSKAILTLKRLDEDSDLEEIGMFHDPLGYEPEDMDNPDEDLVIIGSGYLDIKSNFGERPSQTNGEYAELGQKVVDQLHNGDKEAALDYIFSQINEGSENQTLQVTSYNGTVVLITDPIDIKAFLAGEEVYGEDQDGGSVEVSLDNAQDHQMAEGSCGYGPNGVPGDTPGETKGMPADTRTMTMMRESIRKEIKRLHENK